jgi:hypothetical protein
MKVKVNFEFNLEDLIEDNSEHPLLEDRSKEEVIEELKDLFEGDLNEGFSSFCKDVLESEFGDIFNY